jgi:ubiquinone/menaquinone biosynthesis C-methylase UbiE
MFAVLAMIYDPLVWVLSAGREGALRRATLAAGRIAAGDAVLDAACGTGRLAVAARAVVGSTAPVVGLDHSAAMRARARRRSDRAGADLEVTDGDVGRLPFPDARFDVVVLSLVLHELTPDQAARAIDEARRVLRDGGRVVVVDFVRSHGAMGRLRAHLMLHGAIAAGAPDLGALLAAGGLAQVSNVPSPIAALQIARGTHRES